MKRVDVLGKKKKYLKAKIDKIETNRKIKNITDIYRAPMALGRVTSLNVL